MSKRPLPEQSGGREAGAYWDDRAYRYAQRQQQLRKAQQQQAMQQPYQGARHYAGHEAGIHPDDSPYLTDEQAGREVAVVDAYDDQWPPRLSTSTRRYTTTEHGARVTVQDFRHPVAPLSGRQPRSQVPRRSQMQPAPREHHTRDDYDAHQKPRRKIKVHWTLSLGLGLLILLLGWILISRVLVWWQVVQDDQKYGRPRTYQTDALVSTDDLATHHPSHFIVLNLDGHVVIYYLPGGDPSKTKAYVGMTLMGDQAELQPVTIEIKDVTGDRQPDLIVKADGVIEGVFVNDGKGASD